MTGLAGPPQRDELWVGRAKARPWRHFRRRLATCSEAVVLSAYLLISNETERYEHDVVMGQLLSSTQPMLRLRRVSWQHIRPRAFPDVRIVSICSFSCLQLAFDMSQVVVDQWGVLVLEPRELLLYDFEFFIGHVVELNKPGSRALDAAQ